MPDDWRPKLSRIEDPIADDSWEYMTPQGERRVARLTVGRPVHFPQERCWYSPVMIEGYLAKVTPVFGEGPVDSLMNAMTLIKKFHDENREIVPGVKPRRALSKTPQKKTRGKTAKSKMQRKKPRTKIRGADSR
ncbi:hypothetical protein POL68_05140 [Stigmatella sp. ncwal1]|uniref:HNH endonuclease n=1 Tax=Stigmatella ashevillensis TaxID=2995309 RepID=A0ABT5D3Y8_9BACT|nr:hypothetical protein [Stigmatella ashevillena]MDC0707848.1 hypothetical protein [Stigmatella ashevillena]